jgi:hypothetical protein
MDDVKSFQTTYMIGKNTYVVFVKDDVKYIRPENSLQAVTYDDFIKQQEWRTWIKDTPGTCRDFPKSTASIPLKLTKVIDPKNLVSIHDNGFTVTKFNIAMMGFSKGTQYASRDMHIFGVWLGKNAEVGEQFLEEDEGHVTLHVEVSELFRDMYMRDSYAVLYGKQEEVGSTVICFTPIPADYLYINLPEELVSKITEIPSAKGLKSGYQRLTGLGRNLTIVAKSLTKK